MSGRKSWRQRQADRLDEMCAVDPNANIDRAESDFWRIVYEGDPDATPNEFVGLKKIKLK